MPSPENTPCPTCGHVGLALVRRLMVKPLGTFSLAGAQMKTSAYYAVLWECVCGASGPAEVDVKVAPDEGITAHDGRNN